METNGARDFCGRLIKVGDRISWVLRNGGLHKGTVKLLINNGKHALVLPIGCSYQVQVTLGRSEKE